MERIFATDGQITVSSPDGKEAWYFVLTLNTTPSDYSWMLKNRPAFPPFTVTDENVAEFKKTRTIESAITAAFPGDDAWRSAKAKLQRRDRRGRFAEMGGGFSFVVKMLDGNMFRVSGTIVGQSGNEDVDVKVVGSDVIADGVYSINSKKGEAVKAIINRQALEDSNIGKSKPVSDDVFVDFNDLKAKPLENKNKFRRGKNAKARGMKDTSVDGKLASAGEDGTLEIKRVAPGAVVKDPVTGADISLDTEEDAISYVKNGGDLSEVPDEFVLTAITSNLTRKSDTEPRRFRAMKRGAGINGMMIMRDTATDAVIGYKYLGGISTWWESVGFSAKFIADRDGTKLPPYDYYREALNELFSEKISELLGNEPMPMRIVQSRGGSDAGVSLITELAHNRWEKITNPLDDDTYDDDGVQMASMRSYAAMRLLDLIIGNSDRNPGNYVLAKRSDGEYEIVPIDHSLSFLPEEAGDRLADQELPSPLVSLDGDISKNDYMFDEMIDIAADLQRVLQTIDLGKLSEFFEDAIQLISELRPGLLSDELIELERINMLKTAVERIITALEMSPRRLAAEIVQNK